MPITVWGIRVRFLDVLIVSAAIIIVAAFSFYVYTKAGTASFVRIESQEGNSLYPISDDRIISLSGPLGTTIIEIENGLVHIHSSPCANQTCVAQGSISLSGQWLACMPNRVFVSIEGSVNDKDSVDASTY